MANITNGTVTVQVTGGVGPYQYTLLNAGNNNPVPQNAYPTFTNPVNNVVTDTFKFGDTSDSTGNSGLQAGSYIVKIVDSNLCETLSSVLVVSNATPSPTATPVPMPTSTPVPDPTATVVPDPTATVVPDPTATVVPDPTSTPDPTATVVPDPTATVVPDPTATVVPDPTATVVPDPTATPDLSVTPNPDPDPTAMPVPDPTATEVPDPTATPSQDISNLTFDYHVPLTLDGYTYGLRNENGDTFGYYEDYSLTVANPVYWSHEIFAEPYVGHKWTSTDQLVFEVDGNQIVPDGTIQNNISIVTQIESDGRLSILTKSHNINEDRVHEIRITGGPELVDGSTPIDPPVRRPMLGLTPYNAWMDLVAQWEQENPGCEYNPAFDFATVSFLQVDLLGVTNAEMHDWGLGTSGRIRFMLRVLSETRALDMDLLNEFGQSEKSGCLITPTL